MQLFSGCTAQSPAAGKPTVNTNEGYIHDVTSESINLWDSEAVFQFIFEGLPDSIQVRPTEDYYYFNFYSQGRFIRGNINFGIDVRKQNEISFYYGEDRLAELEGYEEYPLEIGRRFGKADGVELKKINDFSYVVRYKRKEITVNLEQISQDQTVRTSDDEHFLFNTMDESGFSFSLIYNKTAKRFFFALNPARPVADVLLKLEPGLLFGQRSGFAFYEDKALDRKILIAVSLREVLANSYYDGPFDQLADNYIKDDTLKQFAYDSIGKTENVELDNFLDRTIRGVELDRFAISPYYRYRSIPDLEERFRTCSKLKFDEVVRCFDVPRAD